MEIPRTSDLVWQSQMNRDKRECPVVTVAQVTSGWSSSTEHVYGLRPDERPPIPVGVLALAAAQVDAAFVEIFRDQLGPPEQY